MEEIWKAFRRALGHAAQFAGMISVKQSLNLKQLFGNIDFIGSWWKRNGEY